MTTPLFETPGTLLPPGESGVADKETGEGSASATLFEIDRPRTDIPGGPGRRRGSDLIPLDDGLTALLPVWDRHSGAFVHAQVDIDLAPALSRWRWFLDDGYVFRTERLGGGRQRQVSLHRLVMCCAKGDSLEVDHVNRDRLDNRRANLRYATRAENVANRAVSRRVPLVRVAKPRRRKERCKSGHPFTGGNVRIDRRGVQICRACARERNRVYRARRRAARP